ncbi:MAG TPA: ACP S-malonyltransferase [Thermoclostridium sp.]|nr:ACP S-malonyltransferase [Clostridiaceae bacterium]HOQ75488.1 ACP S-malonyltransferase [Thermoclostridium sp.]HPU45735.1 ACP S-malonyltransferase [Thermoclostridium sp.]
MGKIAFIFPGQGAQYIGMGKEISELYPSAEDVFERANNALGFDIRELIFHGDEETLTITENTQPAILTASIACLMPLLEAGIRPDYTAGLSLGEYGAHVLSGTFSFEDAVRVVRKRGKFMQDAVPVGLGAMAAIMGLDREEVIDICEAAQSVGVIGPANFNCPGQIVVAGETAAVNEAVKIASERGAKRAVLLNVSAPFHCVMLEPAGQKLRKVLEDVEVHPMTIPVVANVTGKVIPSEDQVKELLVHQVSKSVFWEDSVRTMMEAGVDTFVEVGPGKVLSGFVRKIDKGLRALNVEDKESLDMTLKVLKG